MYGLDVCLVLLCMSFVCSIAGAVIAGGDTAAFLRSDTASAGAGDDAAAPSAVSASASASVAVAPAASTAATAASDSGVGGNGSGRAATIDSEAARRTPFGKLLEVRQNECILFSLGCLFLRPFIESLLYCKIAGD